MPLKKDVFFVFTSFSPCTSWIFTKGSENWTQESQNVGDHETQSIHPFIHSASHLPILYSSNHPSICSPIHPHFTILLCIHSFIHPSIHPSSHLTAQLFCFYILSPSPFYSSINPTTFPSISSGIHSSFHSSIFLSIHYPFLLFSQFSC